MELVHKEVNLLANTKGTNSVFSLESMPAVVGVVENRMNSSSSF